MKLFQLALMLIIGGLLFVRCAEEETLPEISVKGTVYDDIRNEFLRDYPLYVYGTRCENFRCFSAGTSYPIRTNESGEYQLSFKPEKGIYYTVAADFSSKYTFKDFYSYPLDFPQNTVNFKIRKTSILQLRVIVKNNPYPPLAINSNIIGSNGAKVYKVNNDTTVFLPILPNSTNTISLSVVPPDYHYKFRNEFITFSGFADTVSYTLECDPSTF